MIPLLTAPEPTVAILARNQPLRFVSHGAKGDTGSIQLDGKSWLDLPAFRASKVVGGRSLHIKATIRSDSPSGVTLAHGGNRAGYSVYLREGHLCFATCVNRKRTEIHSPSPMNGSISFQANWNSKGEASFKVKGELVGKENVGIIQHEPGESIRLAQT